MVNFAISFGSFVVGIVCLAIGAWLVTPAAAWMVVGLAFLVMALVPAVRRHP